MRKTKFTETQIVKAIKDHESGRDSGGPTCGNSDTNNSDTPTLAHPTEMLNGLNTVCTD